ARSRCLAFSMQARTLVGDNRSRAIIKYTIGSSSSSFTDGSRSSGNLVTDTFTTDYLLAGRRSLLLGRLQLRSHAVGAATQGIRLRQQAPRSSRCSRRSGGDRPAQTPCKSPLCVGLPDGWNRSE